MASHVPLLILLDPKQLPPMEALCEKDGGPYVVRCDFQERSVVVAREEGAAGRVTGVSLSSLQAFADPHSLLAPLTEQKLLLSITGNCTVDNAQVILIADENHLDEVHNTLLGRIGEMLRGGKPCIILVEGADASGSDGLEAAHQMLPAGFQIRTEDDLKGWDDSYFYRKSVQVLSGSMYSQATVDLLKRLTTGDDLDSLAEEETRRLLAETTAFSQGTSYVLRQGMQRRNESLVKSLERQLRCVGTYKIIVFGGALHLRSTNVFQFLLGQKIRFVAVSPVCSPDAGSLMEALDVLTDATKYYTRK